MAIPVLVALGLLVAGCATTAAVQKRDQGDADETREPEKNAGTPAAGGFRLPVGDYFLADNGDGHFRPGHDVGDALVDANNNLISEKSAAVQKLLKGFCIDSFDGINLRGFNYYAETLEKEKGVLKAASDEGEIKESFERLSGMAREAHIEDGLGSAFAKNVMEYLGPRGYVIPMAYARESAETGWISSMEKALVVAEEYAAEHGQNITGQTIVVRQEGYVIAIENSKDSAKTAIDEADYRFIRNMNSALDNMLTYVNVNRQTGKPLFDAEFIATTTKEAEAMRASGYRKAVELKMAAADKAIVEGEYNYLKFMNSYLHDAARIASDGGIASEFAQKIVEKRRDGYRKAIEGKKASAQKAVDGQEHKWLKYTNSYLDDAVEFAKANVPDTEERVFAEGEAGRIIDEVEKMRDDAYVRSVQNQIDSALSYVEQKEHRWLAGANAYLRSADETAEEGGVKTRVSSKIVAARRKAYEEAIEEQLKGAKSYIEGQDYRWLDLMNRCVETAGLYAEANVVGSPNEDVFTLAKSRSLMARIKEVRKEGYRRNVENCIGYAERYIEDQDHKWLVHMDKQLGDAERSAQEGRVAGEFRLRIVDTRRKGYRRSIENLLAEAKSYIEDKEYRWKENAQRCLEAAEKLIDALVPDKEEHVFTDEQRKTMTAQVEKVRASMEESCS